MLNNIGLPGLLLIAVVVLVLFGRGKISSLMGEVGKGITAFKKGVDEGKQELEAALLAKATVFTDEVAQSVSIGAAQHAVAEGLNKESDVH